MKPALLVLLAGLTLGVSLAHADDRKHVALLDFEGPRSASLRGEIMRIAAAKCWVSSSSKLDGRSLRDFAFDHDVDLVIEGSVERRGREYQVRIRFLRGTTGKAITTATAAVHQPVLDRAARRRVERELARALAAIPPRPNDEEATASVRP